MRIQFERVGGFAGIRLKTEVDTDQLSPEEAKSLQELVEQAKLSDVRQAPRAASNVRDAFEYWLTVQDKEKRHSLRMTDGTIPASVQPLVTRLLALAKKPKASP